MRRVIFLFFIYLFFLRTSSARERGGGALPDFFFFFPCSANHERDWPPCKIVFSGLATNALNMRNNNNNNRYYKENQRGQRYLKARSLLIFVSPKPHRQPIKRLKRPHKQKKSSQNTGRKDQKLKKERRNITMNTAILGTTAKIRLITSEGLGAFRFFFKQQQQCSDDLKPGSVGPEL